MPARKKSIRAFFTFVESTKNADEFRLVRKKGETTFKLLNQPSAKKCFYPNLFISVVELTSKWIALIFLTCFLLSWFAFAFFYYLVCEAHEDLIHITKDVNPCVHNVEDFLSLLLFSMETQTTIGYGSRYVTDECPLVIMLVIAQSIIGTLLFSFLTGVVLFKFQEPRSRAYTILFSKVACLLDDDGKYFMEIQVLNMQKSQIIDPQVTAICVMNREDGSGKLRIDMEFNELNNNSKLFFRPKVYRHYIDEYSPFWEFSKTDLEKGAYEVIVMISGVDEFTDTFVHVRTSFLPSEVLWGQKFKAMTTTKKGQVYRLNYTDFTRTNRTLDMTEDSASVKSRKVSDISISVESTAKLSPTTIIPEIIEMGNENLAFKDYDT